MAADGYSQAVVLVERDSFRRPPPSVAEDRGLGDKSAWASFWRMTASRQEQPFIQRGEPSGPTLVQIGDGYTAENAIPWFTE